MVHIQYISYKEISLCIVFFNNITQNRKLNILNKGCVVFQIFMGILVAESQINKVYIRNMPMFVIFSLYPISLNYVSELEFLNWKFSS